MMGEYRKEMVARDGRTAVSFSPTETVDLMSRGYREADAVPESAPFDVKSSPAPKTKAGALPKGEDVSP